MVLVPLALRCSIFPQWKLYAVPLTATQGRSSLGKKALLHTGQRMLRPVILHFVAAAPARGHIPWWQRATCTAYGAAF